MYSATATEKALDVQAMIQYLQARVRALALNSNLISLHLSSAHHHWPTSTPIYASTWGHLSAVVVRRGVEMLRVEACLGQAWLKRQRVLRDPGLIDDPRPPPKRREPSA